jgi:hypothetical protein
LRHAAGQDDTPITVTAGLRSSVEDRWRGHSPTTEAAVLGVAGQLVPPLGKGERGFC